jgi:hypothetical protein
MKKPILNQVITFAFLLTALSSFAQAHNPDLATVLFNDNINYCGKVLTKQSDKIKIEFLGSHNIYEFDNRGNIISSNGKYKAGEKVKQIKLEGFMESYSKTTSVTATRTLGIVFGDGQVYFGYVLNAEGSSFNIKFCHSYSDYTFQYDGVWKVIHSTGKYPAGHIIKDIYRVSFKSFFYDNENI